MSDEAQREEIARKTIVYKIPAMDAVTVRRDVEYRRTDSGALTMDLYSPPDSKAGERRPATVFVFGFPHPMFAGRFKEMGAYVSWGRLLAASGLLAVTYTYQDPVADLQAVLQHLRQNAEALGIDESRIGVWAASGNVPMALSALMQEGSEAFQCAVLCYGYMLDLEGSTHVAAAAAQLGFVNPAAGKSVDDLPRELPLFIVRAGQDQIPHLNETIDRFMTRALARNLPVTLANHATAPHAFDLFDDSETSREMIRRIVAFLRFHLRA